MAGADPSRKTFLGRTAAQLAQDLVAGPRESGGFKLDPFEWVG